MSTARIYLQQLLEEIEAGPFNVSRVCAAAGMHPSMVSRWRKLNIEPRLSTIERLAEAHSALMAERAIAQQALRQ
jgi:transcriptional regulator with XRE-family HTH domain